MKLSQSTFNMLTWLILLTAVIVPVVAWGSNLGWNMSSLTPYQWFPLLGLWAWLLMWTHYITGAWRVAQPELRKPRFYGPLTAWLVLGALLLHPGILTLEQWQNGAGFPPASWTDYVGGGLTVALLFGVIALLIFLSFEFFDRAKNNKKIQRWWLAISISQSVAMILIFVHALRLGGTLELEWFRIVWILCGLALVPCFYLIHKYDVKARRALLASDK